MYFVYFVYEVYCVLSVLVAVAAFSIKLSNNFCCLLLGIMMRMARCIVYT